MTKFEARERTPLYDSRRGDCDAPPKARGPILPSRSCVPRQGKAEAGLKYGEERGTQ